MFKFFSSKKTKDISQEKYQETSQEICIVEIKEESNIKKSLFQKMFFWKKTKTHTIDSMA